MKILSYLRACSFLFMAAALNLFSAPASLLEDKDLNPGNYTTVRIWSSKKLPQGQSVGHAALQVFENSTLVFNVSLYPDVPVGPFTVGEVKAYWMTAQQDDAHGAPNETTKLFSLNRARMKAEFEKNKAQNTYYMLSTGGSDTVFARDYEVYAKNCASIVREILNYGGLPNLFEKPLERSVPRVVGSVIKHGVAGTAKGALEIFSGIAGGAVGGVGGFIKGASKLENPFTAAEEWAKTSAIATTRVVDLGANQWLGGGTTEHFSYLNYGHHYGECQIVTPWKIGQLAKDARENEKKKFSKTNGW